jgi:uncharacterized membrane protein YbhN (UPF0104 family)
MSWPRRKWLKWGLIAIGLAVAVRAAWRFPWTATREALLQASPMLILTALVVNLTSLVAKGWGWHLLLKPVARNRWASAQKANLIGATVNNISVSVAGEAARVHMIAQADHVPVHAAVASVVWARTVEAIGFALLLLTAPGFLHLSPAVRGAQLAAACGLVLVLILLRLKRGWRLPLWIPSPARSALISLVEIGSLRRLGLPTLLAVYNWGVEWATFHLVLLATCGAISPAASFMALVATNVGGALRLTPANVGIFQVSMVVGLLPFGVPTEGAMAAGLALQAIQVLPVLAAGLGLAGWSGLRQIRAESAHEAATSYEVDDRRAASR